MKHTLTPEQAATVTQYIELHGLTADQISFDGDDPTPSFDHNAVSILSLKLTEIQDISPTQIVKTDSQVTVFSKATLPDGRSRGGVGVCDLDELLANGQKVRNIQTALGVANSRSYSQAVRNVGVKLHEAHKRFVETGEIASGHTQRDPRASAYAEIHMLATELDLIIDGKKEKYQQYLAENYGGRRSAKLLDDIELGRLTLSFRSMARLRREKAAA